MSREIIVIQYTNTKTVSGKKYTATAQISGFNTNKFVSFSVRLKAEKLVFGNWRDVWTGGDDAAKISRLFPELRPVLTVNGCDVHGVNSWGVVNALYFWFNENKPAPVLEGLRVSEPEARALMLANDPEILRYQLVKLGIIDRWQEEARAAVETLEELTGETFKNPFAPEEERANFEPIPAHLLPVIEERINNGYYSPEQTKAREDAENRAKAATKRADMIQKAAAKIAAVRYELRVMLFLLDTFGTVENVIFYDHTKTVGFNWSGLSREKVWTLDEIEHARKLIKKHFRGVSVENRNGK